MFAWAGTECGTLELGSNLWKPTSCHVHHRVPWECGMHIRFISSTYGMSRHRRFSGGAEVARPPGEDPEPVLERGDIEAYFRALDLRLLSDESLVQSGKKLTFARLYFLPPAVGCAYALRPSTSVQ